MTSEQTTILHQNNITQNTLFRLRDTQIYIQGLAQITPLFITKSFITKP